MMTRRSSMGPRRHCSSPAVALLCLVMALALKSARGQVVLNDTAGALSVPEFWLPCGRTTLCPDATACCAIWGVCGYDDRYCGQYCLNGACLGRASPPPPRSGAPVRSPPPPRQAWQPPPPPPEQTIPTFDPTQFLDAIVSVREGEVALAACGEPGWIISAVENAMYGDVENKCNSTLSYMIVSAACQYQPACILPAVNPVFDDPCPRVYKTLQFGYRCQPELEGSSAAPSPPPAKSNTMNPFETAPPTRQTAETGTASPPPASSPSPPPVSPSPPPPLRLSPPPSPRPPSPRPPNPSPPPAAAALPSAPSNAQLSPLWGENGELFTPANMLTDFSQAGYAANAAPIPTHPVKFNVREPRFGAKGDGIADDTNAFLWAVGNASSDARRTGQGVSVLVPRGRYKLTQRISIEQSNVVLRGEGEGATTLIFPVPLAQVYGTGTTWAFGGTWLTILGKNSGSRDYPNYRTDVTADIAQGSKRVQVASSFGIQPGQWLRLFAMEPNQRQRRRQLLAAHTHADVASGAGSRRLLRQAVPAPAPAPGPEGAQAHDHHSSGGLSLVEQLFDDPELRAALNASFVAEAERDAAVASFGVDRVPAQWSEPNATNPLGMEPWLLVAARYAAMALLADPESDDERAPATALDGTLDAYIYGENIVDSGRDGGIYPTHDHIRFISRVSAVGSNWIEFERSIPYDLRLKWRPVVHAVSSTVQHSGFEGFTVEFPWSPYPSHLDVKGFNAFGIYDASNCWMRNLRVINGDNGYIVNGADFVTVANVATNFTKARGSGPVAGLNGHHALWIQTSSNVLMTNFTIPSYRWYHDLSLAVFSESCVYSNGRGLDINIDSHRGGTHHNLLSNIMVGLGTRTFKSGGASFRGAHSGANVTWWNLQKDDGSPIQLPPCDFGPLLFFAGNWLPPSANSGNEDASAEALSLQPSPSQLQQQQLNGTAAPPAPAPAQAPAQGPARGSAAAAAAAVAGAPAPEEDSRAAALADQTDWCSRQKWRVELVDPGYRLWPTDLATAMVAARKRGGVL